VLAIDTPLDEYDRVAVERAVGVIALALLRSRQEEELTMRGRGEFLNQLASGMLEPAEARHRAETLGLVQRRTMLLPLALAITHGLGVSRETLWAAVRRRVRQELEGLGLQALLGDRPREGDLLILVALGRPADRAWLTDRLAEVVHAAVQQSLGSGQDSMVALAAADAVQSWDEAGRALQDAAETAASARHRPPGPGTTPAQPTSTVCCGPCATAPSSNASPSADSAPCSTTTRGARTSCCPPSRRCASTAGTRRSPRGLCTSSGKPSTTGWSASSGS
jgi:PucR family transcriptional regulator, purine catabolism regulatory protein